MNAKPNFNPKNYQGKTRIYISVPRAPRISRLWEWDAGMAEYKPKTYMAKRYDSDISGNRKRVVRFFDSVETARTWQVGGEESPLTTRPEKKKGPHGPLFGEVVEEWKRRTFPRIAQSTRISYENLLRLYFGSLFQFSVHEITPQRIDLWFDQLKNPKSWTMQSKKRTTFKNELKLLSTILTYYGDYHDDPEFQFPIKPRHRLVVRLNRNRVKSKDLREEEFRLFREALRSLGANGELLASLATVQYYQALRISEAAALSWEDVELDFTNPSRSRIRVNRMVVWPRKREILSFVQHGFKNAKSNGGMKEQPMFPETFEALSALHKPGAKGLIFNCNGKHLEYRAIQSAYDRAFKRVALPYRGTHIMRHGGCQRVYNQEGGDLAVAQQLLGNSDLKSTLVYAKRNASALTEVAQRHWSKKSLRVVTSGD